MKTADDARTEKEREREREREEVELASRLHENDILDLHVPLVGLARINGRGYYDAE